MQPSVDFRVGDVVVLKSGSHPMTVGNLVVVNGNQTASVVWQDHNGDHHTANYPAAVLKKV